MLPPFVRACMHACTPRVGYACRVLAFFDVSKKGLPISEPRGLFGANPAPNLITNAVFLVSTMQSVSMSVVNFKGRPFMAGMPLYCFRAAAHTVGLPKP